ncbi:MAG TPA: ribonuclease D [Gemmatimonadales bacterium]|nr:ribonuclease D [Gemmatimonadales bacterium]
MPTRSRQDPAGGASRRPYAPPAAPVSTEVPEGIRLIQDRKELDRLLADWAREPLLAVDTEAASFHRYHDRVYLIQLSNRSETAVVDPLAVDELGALGERLADPAIEVVFHDADYDLRLLDRQYGFRPTRLFDTRIAAQFLNEPGVGLAALLEKYAGVRLDKKYQRADWSARPLKREMIQYAAHDTAHLAGLRDLLRTRLEAAGRLSWAEEEFELLQEVRWSPAEEGDLAFLRLKGAKAMRGRPLAILREVYDWREATAKRLDRASFRIIGNEALFAIAERPPETVEALRAMPGVGGELVTRRGKELLAAVRRGLELPEEKIPRVPRGPRHKPDPAYEARLERLKAARNRLAERLDLAPGVLCPNGTLEAIARAQPASLEALAAVEGVRKWQVEAVGKELLAAAA